MVATLFVFGLKRGVGAETLSEAVPRCAGVFPKRLRSVMHTLERHVLDATSVGRRRHRLWRDTAYLGAVDETFQRMMLVFMVATGYLLMEETASDRSFAPGSSAPI